MAFNTKVTLLATVAIISSMTLPVFATSFDADVYERDVASIQGGDLVEREPWFGLIKAGLGLLGSLGGRKKRKRDLEEVDQLFLRELIEDFIVEMRSLDDALEFDAREFDDDEVELRDFEELEFEAREIDDDMYDLVERDLESESVDAREYEDLEEMD